MSETRWPEAGLKPRRLTSMGVIVAVMIMLLWAAGCDDGGSPGGSTNDGTGMNDSTGMNDGTDTNDSTGQTECTPGQSRPCGPSDQGACRLGTQTCQDDGTWGECEGMVGPSEEVCNGVDDNCNGEVDENFLDLGTPCGVGRCQGGVMECSADGQGTVCSSMPGGSDDRSAPETCNGVDDDCDGEVDEDASPMPVWYQDLDGDGFGTWDVTATSCACPDGFSPSPGDCDDNNALVHPFAGDTAGDGVDTDCDGWDGCIAAMEGETYFVVCRGVMTWDEARQACVDAGYQDLASIRSAQEQSTVYALVRELGIRAWIGYNDRAAEGDWVWSDSSDATYTNWNGGEPNNAGDEDCGIIWGGAAGVWNDLGCTNLTYPTGYVCEVRADGHGDYDLDGYDQADGDCDDTNPLVHPGAEELCDGLDNDCDGDVDEDATATRIWYRDADGDGYGDPNNTTLSCARPSGYVDNASDCDDVDPEVHPFATDYAGDGIDRDCDGMDCLALYYRGAYIVYCDIHMSWYEANTACINGGYDGLASIRDADEETFVQRMVNTVSDGQAWIGYNDIAVEGQWEWVDHATSTFTRWAPGEPNNAGNEDCAHMAPNGNWNDRPCTYVSSTMGFVCSSHPRVGRDLDGDGFTLEQGDCNDFDPTAYPGAPERPGDGIDSDCANDADGDGYDSLAAGGTDCNDSDPSINPGAPEVCNGVDDNCRNGEDDAIDGVVLYRDADGDGYGDPSATRLGCAGYTSGYVTNHGDCYDFNADAHPGQTRFFTTHRGDNSFDYDCDGTETMDSTIMEYCSTKLEWNGCACDTYYDGWFNVLPACGQEGQYGTYADGCSASGTPCECKDPRLVPKFQACR